MGSCDAARPVATSLSTPTSAPDSVVTVMTKQADPISSPAGISSNAPAALAPSSVSIEDMRPESAVNDCSIDRENEANLLLFTVRSSGFVPHTQ